MQICNCDVLIRTCLAINVIYISINEMNKMYRDFQKNYALEYASYAQSNLLWAIIDLYFNKMKAKGKVE